CLQYRSSPSMYNF
nr:immunoglobulin light chain junction region [Macaca mulatta]MOX23530.1 immunoglobulin light chain junction region [Macaca mulatta]MOX23701.1 immunoglobulin light chain junction region [Macaca mulatta]MOX24457.1 immunoglobulin light chain junction region [Macaca mulatta]MOX24465.1 immunoglobulin light chain junction region [Macaca mulatta]